VLLAGGWRVGNLIEPSIEADLLDPVAAAWVQAVYVDGGTLQWFGFSRWVMYPG
jgi:hypothetical protein